MESEDIDPSPTTPRCFRMRCAYLFVGLGTGAFFAVIGIGSTLAALWNIDGSFDRPLLAAWILGSLWFSFFLLAVWMIAAYFRERLLLSGTSIVQDGVFHSKRMEFTDVAHVNWRRRPVGGSVVMRTDSVKITIKLNDFSCDERGELIRTLRNQFSEDIQDDWISFETAFLSPPRQYANRSRELNIVITITLAYFACVFVYLWSIGFGKSYLFIGIINLIAAVWHLSRIRLFNK